MSRFLRFIIPCAVALAAFVPSVARAGDPQGKFQIKAMLTDVVANGEITSYGGPSGAALDGSNARANDNFVPSLAFEYFITPHVSVETICCGTAHHVTGNGALANVVLVTGIQAVPAMVALKYHVDLGPIKPYVGVGPSVTLFINKTQSAALTGLGITRVRMPGTFGPVLQAGVDVPLNREGLGLSLDLKRYFTRPKAYFYDAAGSEQIWTKHKLDPLLLSAGVAWRF